MPPPPPGSFPPPPPPGGYSVPPPYAGPGGAGRPRLQAGDAIAYGFRGFVNNVGPLVVLALVVVAIQLVLNGLGQLLDSWLLSTILSLVGIVIGLMLSLGLIRAGLAITDGRKPEVGMLFQTEGLGAYFVAAVLVGVGVSLGLLLCVVPGLILAFLWQFYGYAIADRVADDPLGAMRYSWNLAKANAGDLLLLLVLTILLNLVGALLCGVGLLVTFPVTAIAIAYAWRLLTGGRLAPQQ